MLTEKDWRVRDEHRRDMLRRAQQDRLAREAQASRLTARVWLHGRLLARLGRGMVALGTWLEARYGGAAHALNAAGGKRLAPDRGGG